MKRFYFNIYNYSDFCMESEDGSSYQGPYERQMRSGFGVQTWNDGDVSFRNM